MEFLQLPEGGHVLLTNTGVDDHRYGSAGAGASAPPSADLMELVGRAERVAGPLPRPRGKQARRLRQAAAREADHRARTAEAASEKKGGAGGAQQADGLLANCAVS